jgi:hypothetical protein
MARTVEGQKEEFILTDINYQSQSRQKSSVKRPFISLLAWKGLKILLSYLPESEPYYRIVTVDLTIGFSLIHCFILFKVRHFCSFSETEAIL